MQKAITITPAQATLGVTACLNVVVMCAILFSGCALGSYERSVNAPVLAPTSSASAQHVYEVRPRKDRRGVDLISDALPFGRLFDMLPNLRDWLLPLRKVSGKITPENFRKHFESAREAAEIAPWPNNALRHSYGSYHLKHFGNDAQTQLQMGHWRDSSVLFGHYRRAVTRRNAERYWDVKPAKADKKIVQMRGRQTGKMENVMKQKKTKPKAKSKQQATALINKIKSVIMDGSGIRRRVEENLAQPVKYTRDDGILYDPKWQDDWIK